MSNRASEAIPTTVQITVAVVLPNESNYYTRKTMWDTKPSIAK